MVECEHEIFEEQNKKKNSMNENESSRSKWSKYNIPKQIDQVEINKDESNESNIIKDSDAKRIMRSTDLFEILGISDRADDEVIKKTYKKLALKFHPDKNQSIEAEEIFQKIFGAYNILINPDKRNAYRLERHKSEPNNSFRRRNNETEASYENFQRRFERSNPYQYSDKEFIDLEKEKVKQYHRSKLRQKFYFIFKIILAAVFILGFLYYYKTHKMTKQLYSTEESEIFFEKLTTPHLNLAYYVGEEFIKLYAESAEINFFGLQLEKRYVENLIEDCIHKVMIKDDMLEKANLLSGRAKENLLQDIDNFKMESCELKNELKKIFPFLFA